jgi:hypothetical protein
VPVISAHAKAIGNEGTAVPEAIGDVVCCCTNCLLCCIRRCIEIANKALPAMSLKDNRLATKGDEKALVQALASNYTPKELA